MGLYVKGDPRGRVGSLGSVHLYVIMSLLTVEILIIHEIRKPSKADKSAQISPTVIPASLGLRRQNIFIIRKQKKI